MKHHSSHQPSEHGLIIKPRSLEQVFIFLALLMSALGLLTDEVLYVEAGFKILVAFIVVKLILVRRIILCVVLILLLTLVFYAGPLNNYLLLAGYALSIVYICTLFRSRCWLISLGWYGVSASYYWLEMNNSVLVLQLAALTAMLNALTLIAPFHQVRVAEVILHAEARIIETLVELLTKTRITLDSWVHWKKKSLQRVVSSKLQVGLLRIRTDGSLAFGRLIGRLEKPSKRVKHATVTSAQRVLTLIRILNAYSINLENRVSRAINSWIQLIEGYHYNFENSTLSSLFLATLCMLILVVIIVAQAMHS
ncbi:MAG: hypothetical protein QW081_06225 [Desulfurococcaceae archaeon]